MGEHETVRITVRQGLVLGGRARGRTGPVALVAPPHPLYGGSIGNPVVRALEAAFMTEGLATLAFDFRGVGDSDGDPSGDFGDALEDYLAAARSVEARGLACCSGYSFGGAAALRAAVKLGVGSALLVSPPMGMLDLEALGAYRGTLHVVTGSADEYGPPDVLHKALEGHPRATLHVIEGADHFFYGSGVTRLTETLTRVTRSLVAPSSA